ncbi:hypothetical protein BGX27_008138, partial [Mortierella sp. AM989]
ITHLKLLQKLSLANNRFQESPEPISMFTQLTWLSLASNTLTSLPDSFSNLQKLTCLDLQRNRFSSIPDCVYQMKSLTILLLQKNRITTISPKIGQCTQLVSLNLSYNRIQHLPVEMKECRNLEHLLMSVNTIQELPGVLCEAWTSLLNLDMHTNDLKVLPDQLGSMKSLRRLNLAINKITDIPDSIGQLNLLEWLNLNDNKLVTLPTTMDHMQKLVKMGIVQNKLKTLPAELARLTLLYKLDCRRNEIEYLPSSFKDMQGIHSLLLEENLLSVKYGIINYDRQPPSLLELASRAVLERYCPQDSGCITFSTYAQLPSQSSNQVYSNTVATENLSPMMVDLGTSKPLPALPPSHHLPTSQKSRYSFFSRGSSTVHPQPTKPVRSATLTSTCSSDSSSSTSSALTTSTSPSSTTLSSSLTYGSLSPPNHPVVEECSKSVKKSKSSPRTLRAPSLFRKSSKNQQNKLYGIGHIQQQQQQPSTPTSSLMHTKKSCLSTRRKSILPRIEKLLDPEVSFLPIPLIDQLSTPTTACDYCSRRMLTAGWIDFLEPTKLGSSRMVIPVRHRMCSLQCVRQQHRDSFGTDLSDLFESTDFHVGLNGEMIGSRPIVPGELDEYMIEAVQEAAEAAGISITYLLEQHQQSQQQVQQEQQQQQQEEEQVQQQEGVEESISQFVMPGTLPTSASSNILNMSSSGPTSVIRQTTARLRRSLSRSIAPIEIQVDSQGQLRRVVYRQNKNSTGPRRRILETFRSLSQVGHNNNGQGGLGVLVTAGLGNNNNNNNHGNNGGGQGGNNGGGEVGRNGGSNRAPGEVMNVTTFAVELERF